MDIKQLLSEARFILEKDKQQREEARKRGELYNVFNVLGVSGSEQMHSAFLAALLNPDGDHGMRDAFLKAFLTNIDISFDFDTAHAKVETERYIGTTTDTTGGRMDIFVTDGRCAIIIENKIWASDQYAQLVRYHNYGAEHYANNFALLYLTLDGQEPSEQSKGKLDEHKNDYRCISYRTDIIPWLHQCAQLAFDKPPVREVISQYINILRQLTNQDTMEENKEELIKLLANQANFQSAWSIAENMFAVKQYLVGTILCEQLAGDSRYTISNCSYDTGNYCGIDIIVHGWKTCSIKFEFESHHGTTDLCYGIVGTQMSYKDIFEANGYEIADIWPAWKWMPRYRYWNMETFMDIYSGAVAEEMKVRIEELLQVVKENNMEL